MMYKNRWRIFLPFVGAVSDFIRMSWKRMDAAGVYLVKVGDRPAQRVVIVR